MFVDDAGTAEAQVGEGIQEGAILGPALSRVLSHAHNRILDHCLPHVLQGH